MHSEEFFETCAMLITFICMGKYLECVAKGRTCAAIAALMGLAPPTAVLLEVDCDGKVLSEEDIPTSLVQRGDILKVCSCTARPPLCRALRNYECRHLIADTFPSVGHNDVGSHSAWFMCGATDTFADV